MKVFGKALTLYYPLRLIKKNALKAFFLKLVNYDININGEYVLIFVIIVF